MPRRLVLFFVLKALLVVPAAVDAKRGRRRQQRGRALRWFLPRPPGGDLLARLPQQVGVVVQMDEDPAHAYSRCWMSTWSTFINYVVEIHQPYREVINMQFSSWRVLPVPGGP